MRYFQKYSYDEHNHGTQTVIFAVSDSYEELFEDTGTETDIFVLESVRKDLNTEDGSFAIDELPFSVNQLACQTDDDHNALFFCLNATDLKFNRYCALFFGSLPILENLDFIGKIDSKVSGDDKIWQSSNYGFEINPLREYNFTAYSFDVSILEMVKLTSDIKSSEGIPVSNVYQKFEDENWVRVKQIFNNKPAYALDQVINPIAEFCKLGNLFDIIRLYLDLAEEIIYDKDNNTVEFNVIESSLGLKTNPVQYSLTNEATLSLQNQSTDANKIIELKLSQTESGENWSVPFLNRKMVDAELGCPKSNDEFPEFINDYHQHQVGDENSFSFRSLDNVAEILFEIARAFACYILPSYTAGNQINLEYKSRESIVENDYTYIIGSQEASFDSSPVLSKKSGKFYGHSGAYATDGFDKVSNEHNTSQVVKSASMTKKEQVIKYDKERRGIESRKLMLTTSPTLLQLSATNENHLFPINLIGRGANNNNWDLNNFTGFGYPGNVKYNDFLREYLHTGIYVKTIATEPNQITRLGSNPIWRPASTILVKVGQENTVFNTLSEYCDYIMARDVQYYQTEYNLTIPYWNGFSKNSDGSNPSWKNIKLGSKVKLYETIKRYDSEEEWIDVDVHREYVVVGIERNLQKPETTLKLHSLDRFAFGTWDLPTPPPSYIFQPNVTGKVYDESLVSEYLEISDESPEILSGDVVMINPNRKVFKAENKSEYYHYPIGIALSSGNTGDTIVVQLSGIVKSERYHFLQAGKMVQLRHNPTELNLSTTLLAEKTSDEDMIVMLGHSLSPDSFYLSIKEMVIE